MTWPGRNDVLPALVALVTALGAVIAAMVAAARLARPWMRQAAREAAEEVRAEVKAEVKSLADKLATNDFPHIEKKIDSVEAKARVDRAAMESRIGERLDRMEARLLAAMRGQPEPHPPDAAQTPDPAAGAGSQ